MTHDTVSGTQRSASVTRGSRRVSGVFTLDLEKIESQVNDLNIGKENRTNGLNISRISDMSRNNMSKINGGSIPGCDLDDTLAGIFRKISQKESTKNGMMVSVLLS